tara:strand:+ start:699 stop:9008 length:8310 start_codon:yes stop_codon:yes gene_type:complete
MNEQAFNDLYEVFVNTGYRGAKADFKNLMSTNSDAFNEGFGEFTSTGYNGDADAFAALIGVTNPLKKKDTSESLLEDGGSEQSVFEGDAQRPLQEIVDESPIVNGDDYRTQPGPSPYGTQDISNLNFQEDESEAQAKIDDPYYGTALGAMKTIDEEFEAGIESSVTDEMMDQVEEFAVPEMNYKFGRYGFDFKEIEGGDAMRVTAYNDKHIDIDLDRLWWSSNDEAPVLEQFLRDNRDDSQSLENLTKGVLKDEEKIHSEKSIMDAVGVLNERAQLLDKEHTEYLKFKSKTDATGEQFANLTKGQLAADPVLKAAYGQWLELKNQEAETLSGIRQKNDYLMSQGARLDRMAGEYTEMQEKQGNYSGGVWNNILTGVSIIGASGTDIGIDIGTYFTPNRAMGEKLYLSELIRVAREQGNVPKEYQAEGKLEGLSKDELIEALGGDTNDMAWVANGFFNRLEQAEEGYKKSQKNKGRKVEEAVMDKKDRFPETAFDQANAKVMDIKRKSVKEFETYEQAVKGRYRNPYSETAFSLDTTEGMLDGIRKSLVNLMGDDSVTEAWDRAEKQKFWGGAILGLAQSLPAMIGSSTPLGWAQRTVQMAAQVSDHTMEEMEENSAFDNITETEKAMVKMPIAIAVGVLESVGFRNVLNQKGFLNKIVGRSLGKFVETKGGLVGARNFADFIRQDVKSMIARGGLTVTAAGLAEFETGFAQEIAEVSIKEIYNLSKESEMFDTPDTWIDFAAQAIRAGAQEAVGGFIMGTPSAVANAVSGQDMKSLNNTVYEVFEKMSSDPALNTMYVTKLKQRILDPSDDTDAASAKAELAIVEQLRGIVESGAIPSDYTTQQKKEALQLLYQKNALENEIAVEDNVLSKRKQELLNNVNNRLAALTNESISIQEEATVETTKVQDFKDGETETTTMQEGVTSEEQSDIDAFFSTESENEENLVAPNLSINRKGGIDLGGSGNKNKNKLVRIATMGAKAIAKILPNARIVLHETNEEYLKYAKLGDGRAEYNAENTTIHINLSKATNTTVPHEIFHAVLMDKIKSDPAIAKAAEQMVLSVQKLVPKDSALGKRIEQFAAGYKGSELQNEERLAELVGILSSEYRQLDRPSKNVIIEFLKNIARKFGIEIGSDFGTKDADVIDLLNVISRKTRTGEEITEDDLAILNGEVSGKISSKAVRQQTDFENINLKRFPTNPNVKLEEGVSLARFSERTANLLESDRMTGSFISDNPSLKFFGGLYFPVITGKWWASRTLSKAQGIATNMNSNRDEDGYIYATPIVMKPNSHMSNQDMFETVWEFMKHDLRSKSNKVTKGLFHQYITKALSLSSVNLKESDLSIKKSDSIEAMIGKLNKVLLGEDGTLSFNKRRAIIKAILGDPKSNEGRKFPTAGSISEMATKFEEEKTKKATKLWDIVMLMRTKGNLSAEVTPKSDEFYHKSYPAEISSDGEVEVYFLDGAYNIDKTYPELKKSSGGVFSWAEYSDRHPSTAMALSQYGRTAKLSKAVGVISSAKESAQPKARQQKSIAEIARYYNMNTEGFLPKQVDLYTLKKSLPPGFGVKQSKFDQYGRGGSYYITNSRGKKINPLASRARQQKSITEIIKAARESNFREPQIKDYLVRTKKFSVTEVDKLMKLDVDLLTAMPKSFGAIEGGAKKGIALYTRIDKFKQKLTKLNKKRKNKLSDQEIVDKTIVFLEQQPEYIAESDFYTTGSKKKGTQETKRRTSISQQQARMLADLQSAIGIRPTQNMGLKIKAAQLFLRQAKKGGIDLQKIKSQVRNLIRKSLPKELYERKDVLRLIDTVNEATEESIENTLKEVVNFVIETNVKSLNKKINDILNDKYQAVEGNRLKPKKITDEIRKRIDFIKKNILGPKATKEQIEDAIVELKQRLDELMGTLQLTQGQQEEMVDIQLAINYNNAMLMANDNPSKVTVLDGINMTLVEMIQFGRSLLKEELLRKHQYYNEQFEQGYEAITGDIIDTSDLDAKTQLNNRKKQRAADEKRRRATQNVIRHFFSDILGKMSNWTFGTAEAMDGLMMMIDKLPGKMFGGRLNEMFTDLVDAASRRFKMRMMEVESVIAGFLFETYGKQWKKVSRENRIQRDLGIELHDGIMLEALSQDQIAYFYNMWKNPENRASFANAKMWGAEVINKEDTTEEKKRKQRANRVNATRIMGELEAQLDPKVKAVADWQVEVLYPSLYEEYNRAYKKLYRTDLPWNKFYAGTIYRDGVTEQETQSFNLLNGGNIYKTSVGANATKLRQGSNLPIQAMNQMDVLNTYINDMEYSSAYGEVIRDMDKFFSNEYVKAAIKDIHGSEINTFIRDMIDKLASQNQNDGAKAFWINGMNNVFLISRLALSPVIAIKQLTSMFTYANDIGPLNWLKYAAINKTEQVKVWKEVTENSVYMKDRNNTSIMKAIETYTDTKMKEFVPRPTKDWIINFLMYTTKIGDRGAIMLGGLPNYSYYKANAIKDGKTEEEAIQIAIRKFERDTKRTQQSADLQDKDYTQTGHPVVRAMNMFLTTPKQYLRKEIIATRELYRKLAAWDRNAGKGTVAENLRTFVVYHFFMPVLFQYVAMGLPGILRGFRDDDDEDLLRAGIVGNLNALFIIGEIVAAAGDAFTNKPWAGSQAKTVGIIQIANGVFKDILRANQLKDPEKKAKAWRDVYLELSTVVGLPMPTIARFFDNYGKLDSEADVGKLILRLLNYSNYQIEGPRKRGSSKSAKTIEQMNAEYLKEKKKNEKKQSGSSLSGGGLGSDGLGSGGLGGGVGLDGSGL